MSSKALLQAVEQIAEEKSRILANFSPQDAVACGKEKIKQALLDWCGNFEGLISDYSLLGTILNGLTFVEDSDILTAFYAIKNDIISSDETFYYCRLGEACASSHRIMAGLNKEPDRYKDSLSDLLNEIGNAGELATEYPTIIFIDDFLNSGGQLRRIINSWTNNNPQDNIDNNNSSCLTLNIKQRDVLKKCKLVFFFYSGTTPTKLQLEKEIQEKSLTGQIIIHQTLQEYGIFGDKNDVNNIKNKSDEYISQKSIFAGKKGSELFELYNVCEEAGLQLLRQNEPNWQEEKIRERCLGYGNSPRLYIGQNNIPTFTMTALWQKGEVIIGDKKVQWQYFLPRRKKITRQSEDRVKSQRPILRFDKRADNLSNPFEIHIVGTLDSAPDANVGNMPDSQSALESHFSQEVVDSLGLELKEIPKQQYHKYNNHLAWFIPDKGNIDHCKKIPVSIEKIRLLLSDKHIIFSAQIIVKADEEPIKQFYQFLKQAREINYKTKKWHDGFLGLKTGRDSLQKYTVPELLTNIFRDINLNIARSSLFLAYFMRVDQDAISCEDMAKDSDLMQSLTLNSAKQFDFSLREAAVAASEKVSAFICKNLPINNSGAFQKEIADVYVVLEMLNRQCIKLEQTKEFNVHSLSQHDAEKLDTIWHFFKKARSSNPHTKEYMNILCQRLSNERR